MSLEMNRHHKARIKNKCKKYFNASTNSTDPKEKAVILGKVSRTPKSCNCWMCTNNRKVFGPNFNEIRGLNATNLNEGFLDYNENNHDTHTPGNE